METNPPKTQYTNDWSKQENCDASPYRLHIKYREEKLSPGDKKINAYHYGWNTTTRERALHDLIKLVNKNGYKIQKATIYDNQTHQETEWVFEWSDVMQKAVKIY